MMAMYYSETHRCWDENLNKIGFAIRTSKHEVTKVFVNIGRNMVLSGRDYVGYKNMVVEDGTKLSDTNRGDSFVKLYNEVQKRLEEANEKSCDRYNLRRRNVGYLPNQPVWMINYVLVPSHSIIIYDIGISWNILSVPMVFVVWTIQADPFICLEWTCKIAQ
ncbi:hypothetical protein JTB14_021728 [Gonioctena quinquepunctata]|nr:hypothetical protein JTB14_021728 [Gonioctena quinquepunctata]